LLTHQPKAHICLYLYAYAKEKEKRKRNRMINVGRQTLFIQESSSVPRPNHVTHFFHLFSTVNSCGIYLTNHFISMFSTSNTNTTSDINSSPQKQEHTSDLCFRMGTHSHISITHHSFTYILSYFHQI